MREAIDSALSQTYKNIEVIVVNDGSRDEGETDSIARAYGDRIRYFFKENGGVATALNLGITQADGEFISWLSHDDVYYENKVQTQINYFNDHTDEKIVLFSNFDILNSYKNKKYSVEPLVYKNNIFNNLKLLFSSSIHGCTMMMRKSCFESLGLFSEKLITTQDYDYWFKMVKNGYVFRYIPEPLILTRHHEDQGTIKLIDCHLAELHELYLSACKLFSAELCSFSSSHLAELAGIARGRGLIESYNYLHELQIFKENMLELDIGKPAIWLYWENEEGTSTPGIIELCRETIINRNSKNFIVILVTPSNIEHYLPDINRDYLFFEKIAHRADYIRYNLLYHYGGIWLDSDFVAFRSLAAVLKNIQKYGFVYTGYIGEDGKIFPLIAFLGSQKHNDILKRLIEQLDIILKEKIALGLQPSWNEIGGLALEPLLNEKNSYRYDTTLFAPLEIHGYGQRQLFFPSRLYGFKYKKCFGQMLAFSTASQYYHLMGHDILSTSSYLASILKKNLPIIKTKVSFLYRIVRKAYDFIPQIIRIKIKKILRSVYYYTPREIRMKIRRLAKV